MKDYKILLKGAGLTIIGLALSKLFFYAINIIVARIGSTELGLLNLGFSIVSFVAMIALLGLNGGLIRYISYYLGKKDKRKIKGVILDAIRIPSIIGIISFVLILIFADKIAILFNKPELTKIIFVFSFTIPFLILIEIFASIFASFKKIQYNVFIRDIFDKFMRLVLVIIFITLGFGLMGIVYAYTIAIILTAFLLVYFSRKKEFILFNKKVKAVFSTKELLVYSFPLTLSSLLTLLQKWTDIFILGYYKTASEVGIYNISFSTAALLSVIPTALMSLFIPVISNLYAQNKLKEIKAINTTVMKWIFIINLFFTSILIIFGKELVRIVFGLEYTQGYTALVILAISYLMLSLTHVYSNNLLTIKKTKLVSLLVFISTFIVILLNFLLVPKYGINGAAIATITATFVFLVLIIISSYVIMRLQPINKIFIKSLIAGILTIVLFIYLYKILSINFLILVILILLTFIFYLILLILFKCFSKDDISLIKDIKNKLYGKLKNFNLFSNE